MSLFRTCYFIKQMANGHKSFMLSVLIILSCKQI